MQSLRTVLLTTAVLISLYPAYLYLTRTPAPDAAPAVPAPMPRRTEEPAPPAAATTPASVAVESQTIMPLDGLSLEQFQEASSRASATGSALQNDAPYAVAASRAARQAIAALGHNPDFTLRYWLSPQFAADLAAGDPAAAVSTRRTVDNMLSILLGDTAGPEDFAQILQACSPEVQTLATQRRAQR